MKRYILLGILIAVFVQLSAQTLNVATYNIRLHSKTDYAKGDGWTERRDAMCDLVAFMAFDIFGAQEVCHDQLTDMLERLPQYDYVGVARDDGATIGEYSPVFYRKDRFKVLESGTFWLSETPDSVSYGWDADCRRVCSWAHFEENVTKKDFWFFNTHLDHIGTIARAEGAKLILNKIRSMCDANAAIILTGDFNVAQNTPAYTTLATSGLLQDSYDLAPIKYAPAGTFNNFDVNRHSDNRIDHIFVAGADVLRYGILTFHYWREHDSDTLNNGECRNSVHLQSDHYPVQVIIKLDK